MASDGKAHFTAARDEVEKEENHHLGCYTFDELLDQDADFSGYLDWLEEEVKRRILRKSMFRLPARKKSSTLLPSAG
jgi:hypothetical protein